MKCPNCKSKNTIKTREGTHNSSKVAKKVVAGAVFLPLAFAVGKKQKVGECFDCGQRWKV